MNQAIGAVAALETAGASAAPAAGGAAAVTTGFGDLFVRELNAVDSRIKTAEQAAQQLAVGQGESLHTVMIQMEEAKLSLQLLAQVRNRLLDAYQEVMRMQV
jgi:flagellar hook-basal body complex protein FliE